jgi:plasmid stabilization system protein ParE
MVWTRQAGADRQQIREYIAQDNPTAALALDELISEKAGRLAVSQKHPSWLYIRITS